MRAAKTTSKFGYQIEKHKHGRFFNVLAPDGALICVAVYRKGAAEVIRRLEEKQRKSDEQKKRPDGDDRNETACLQGQLGPGAAFHSQDEAANVSG